jgi:hypothetical protein
METLDADDKFFCDKCKSLQDAQKWMKIKALPRILCLHLKRFKYIEQLDRCAAPFESQCACGHSLHACGCCQCHSIHRWRRVALPACCLRLVHTRCTIQDADQPVSDFKGGGFPRCLHNALACSLCCAGCGS